MDSKIRIVLAVLGFILTILVTTGSCFIKVGHTEEKVLVAEKRLDSMEQEIESLKKIKEDVAYIRGKIETWEK